MKFFSRKNALHLYSPPLRSGAARHQRRRGMHPGKSRCDHQWDEQPIRHSHRNAIYQFRRSPQTTPTTKPSQQCRPTPCKPSASRPTPPHSSSTLPHLVEDGVDTPVIAPDTFSIPYASHRSNLNSINLSYVTAPEIVPEPDEQAAAAIPASAVKLAMDVQPPSGKRVYYDTADRMLSARFKRGDKTSPVVFACFTAKERSRLTVFPLCRRNDIYMVTR